METAVKNKLQGLAEPISKQADERIKRRDALFKPVEIVKTSSLLTPQFDGIPVNSLPNLENTILVTTPEGMKVVNTCSNQYRLVPIQDVLLPFEEALDSVFDYSAVYRHSDYCRFFVDYIMKKPSETAVNDKIAPRIRLQHSYSGDVRYEVKFGFYRQICSNGLHAIGFDQKIRTKHTKNRLDEELGNMIEIVQEFVEHAEDYMKPFQMMDEVIYDTPIMFEERIDAVIDLTGFPKNLKENIVLRASLERAQNNLKQSDWLIYNAMNYQLNHNYTELGMQEWNRQKLDERLLQFFLN